MKKKYIHFALVLAIFISLTMMLFKRADEFTWKNALSHPGLFAVSVFFTFITISGIFVLWWWLMNRPAHLHRLSALAAYKQFSLANLSRYLPGGKILQFASFAHFSVDPKQKANSVISFLILTFIGVMAGGILGVFGFTNLFPRDQAILYQSMTFVFLVVCFLICDSKMLARILGFFQKRLFPSIEVRKYFLPRGQLLLLMIAAILLNWVTDGLAGLFLLWMTNSTYTWDIVIYILGCYAAASLGAHVMVLAPAGLGVRDGLFAFFLAKKMLPSEAVFISLGLRFASLLAECIFTLPLVFLAILPRIKKNRVLIQP